ncbi:MAG: hypothetical protein J1D87_04145 [Lachnospiraceae bacterium]|nr:hypothetical protein [Lachnospiraceae bacterium]
MEAITGLTQIDFSYAFISIFAILIGIKAIVSLFEWIINKLGIETKSTRCRREEHELLIKTSQELCTLQEKLAFLTNTVNGIAKTLKNMHEKDNETKLKELKSSLIRYYNKYKEIGEWSKLEKDAFWDLFNEYEKRGGDGYIHTIVEPLMREIKEIE